MIHVIASVRVKRDRLTRYIEVVRDNAVRVRQERGCIEYTPAVDLDAGIPAQTLDDHVVTIIEKWENETFLHDHLRAPHMQAYREKVRDMVESVSLRILREA